MGVPTQRDLDQTRETLLKWLSGRLSDASGIEIGPVTNPSGAGFTNETLFFDAEWTSGGQRESRSLALRVKATDFNFLYRAPDFFEPQYRLMTSLGQRDDIPVPRVHWYEEDDGFLGAPFFVMDRIAGRVQPDMPPYWQEGCLHDASPEQQTTLWRSAVETVASINTLDWRAAGLDFLTEMYPAGLDGRLQYYDEALQWAAEDEANPIAEAGRQWLAANRPAGPEPLALSWGDARLGNLIFRDFRTVGVIDWEMASIGHPLQDLGWWFLVEKALLGDAHTGDPDDPNGLPGFPSKAQTVALWGEATGLSVDDFAFYEAFAAFRLAVHLQRMGTLFKTFGVIGPDSPWPVNNIGTQALAPLIGIDHPPPEPMPTLPS
jgi:aminoglycoside phosphotransferase (APT) family kinase protein